MHLLVLNRAIFASGFEEEVDKFAGEFPVTFQRRNYVDGAPVKYFLRVGYLVLSSNYTWEMLRKRFLAHAADNTLRVAGKELLKLSRASFRKLLIMEYLATNIALPRRNVYSGCVINAQALGSQSDVGNTELMFAHVSGAMSMRWA